MPKAGHFAWLLPHGASVWLSACAVRDGTLTPRRIGIDATAAIFGGGAIRVQELMDSFTVLAPQHEYVVYLRDDLLPKISPPNEVQVFEIRSIYRSAPLRSLWQQLAFPRTLKGARLDWLLSPFNIIPLGPGFPRSTKRAVILSNIGPFAPEIRQTARGYQRLRALALQALTLTSLRQADRVFLLSAEARRLLHSSVSHDRVTLVPMAPPGPGVLDEADRLSLPSSLVNRPFFIVVGDLLPHKGVEDAITAISLLARTGTVARLFVVGHPMSPEYSARLREKARKLAPEAISFVGAVTHSRALALMRAAVATIVCSRVENPNRVPTEAMAVGSPLIAIDVPTARETCGDAALYYSPGSPQALARCMLEVIRGGHRDELVARGRKKLSGLDWLSASKTILEAMDVS